MSFWGPVPKRLADKRAKAAAECKRNAETQRLKMEAKQQQLAQRTVERQTIVELQSLLLQSQGEAWQQVMTPEEKQARDLLGITWDQSITEAVVKVFARDRSKELHPDKNPGIDPQRYVQMMDARDYLLDLIKKAS